MQCEGELENLCFTQFSIFFRYIWRSAPTAAGTKFLGLSHQPSVGNLQLLLMVFETEQQRRGTSSFKAKRLNNSATETPMMQCNTVLVLYRFLYKNRIFDKKTASQLASQTHRCSDRYIHTVCGSFNSVSQEKLEVGSLRCCLSCRL